MPIDITSTSQPFTEDVVASTRPIDTPSAPEPVIDDVISMLEGTPNSKRGDRKRPTILRFPSDLGDADMPHAMQFKVFWRWEAKSIVDAKKKKVELDKKIQALSTISSLIEGSAYTEENIAKVGIEQAVQNRIAFKNTLNTLVNPDSSNTINQMIRDDPMSAKQFLEGTIKSTQTEVNDLNNIIGAGGKTDLTQNDRAQFSSTRDIQAIEQRTKQLASAAGVDPKGFVGTVSDTLVNVPEYDQMVSVYLPTCTKINNEDTFSYEESSFKMLGGIAGLANIDSFGGAVDAAAQGAQAALAHYGDRVGVGGERQLTQGTVLNPKLEKMFKQKDFRSFNFSWEMYPKSEEETEIIRDIIETFRYHAHPSTQDQLTGDASGEQSKTEVMLRVPAEFEIRFLSTNPRSKFEDSVPVGFVENPYIPKIGRCVCTSISVDYTPQSLFSTFINNAPVGVIFNLSFSEVGLITRDEIDKGF